MKSGIDGYEQAFDRYGDSIEGTCVIDESELARLRAEAEKAGQARIECAEMYKRAEYFKRQSVARLEHLGDYIDNPDLFIAEAEAWRAVRACWDQGCHVTQLFSDIRNQIARLDQLKEGKSNVS